MSPVAPGAVPVLVLMSSSSFSPLRPSPVVAACSSPPSSLGPLQPSPVAGHFLYVTTPNKEPGMCCLFVACALPTVPCFNFTPKLAASRVAHPTNHSAPDDRRQNCSMGGE